MPSIHVVEDDRALRDLLKTIFSKMGFHTEASENGEDALKLLEQHEPDLLLTDIMMPKMGGLALIKKLETLYPKVKVITLSGAVHHCLREEGDDMVIDSMDAAPNVVAHIKKPFKIEAIVDLVKKQFE